MVVVFAQTEENQQIPHCTVLTAFQRHTMWTSHSQAWEGNVTLWDTAMLESNVVNNKLFCDKHAKLKRKLED